MSKQAWKPNLARILVYPTRTHKNTRKRAFIDNVDYCLIFFTIVAC